MIATAVALHDIKDAENFVAATILRAKILMTQDEFDELKCEGLVILYDLAARFEPHRPGYDKPGRFSGYAARYLPGKLQDSWRRLHPEHRHTRTQDGAKAWEYGCKPLSLSSHDDAGAFTTGSAPVFLHATAAMPTSEAMPLITSAIEYLPTACRQDTMRFLDLTHEGHGVDTIASTMGVRRGDVQRLRADISAAIDLAREAA